MNKLTLSLLFLLHYSMMSFGTLVTPDFAQKEVNATEATVEVYIDTQYSYYDERGEIQSRSQAVIQSIKTSRADFTENVGNLVSIDWTGGEVNGIGSYISGFYTLKPKQTYILPIAKKENENRYRITGLIDEHQSQNLTGARFIGAHSRIDGNNGEGTGPFLSWNRRALPIPYFISTDNLPDPKNFLSAIDQSFVSWRNVNQSAIDYKAMGCIQNAIQQNDGQNVIIFKADFWPFNQDAIAVTRTFYLAGEQPHAGEILDADIVLNTVNFRFSVSEESGKHDIRNILTHEIGHFSGLGHETTPIDETATMFAVAHTGETTKRILKSSDIQIIREAYPGTFQKPIYAASTCLVQEGGSGCANYKYKNSAPPSAYFPIEIIMVFIYAMALHLRKRTILNAVTI